MIEDKVNAFLEELEKRGIEIIGETVFVCNDGAVMFMPTERNTVDIALVRNPIKIDYTLGITDEDMKIWRAEGELMQELGGDV